MNQQIAVQAEQAIRTRLPGFPREPRMCLGFAFEVIGRVFNVNRWVMYSRLGVGTRKTAKGIERWALDAEKALDKLNFEVTTTDLNPRVAAELKRLMEILKPGDILFSSKPMDEGQQSANTAPDLEGHVGIYCGKGLVAENTTAFRTGTVAKHGNQVLAPLASWNTVTTVARIPENWRV